MKNDTITNNNKLEKILNDFCEKNNLPREMFEIAQIGKGLGNGERKVLLGPSNVKNKNCIYVIKVFLKYNIIIIWNYKNNQNMSYPYLTLKEKLDNGICEGDKGKGFHPNNQSKVLFENTENFKRLLSIIADKK